MERRREERDSLALYYDNLACSEDVAVAVSYAYFAHGDKRTDIVDIAKPAEKLLVAHHLDALALVSAVNLKESLAYHAIDCSGLRSTPACSKKLATLRPTVGSELGW